MKTFIGYGSLLSKKEVLETCPSATNFRVVRVHGFQRILNAMCSLGNTKWMPNKYTQEVAVMGATPNPLKGFWGLAFDIADEDVARFERREMQYELAEANFREADHPDFNQIGTIAVTATFEELRNGRYREEPEALMAVMAARNDVLFSDDILPADKYLRCCIDAAKKLGDTVHDSLLKETVLSDGVTTLEKYLGGK